MQVQENQEQGKFKPITEPMKVVSFRIPKKLHEKLKLAAETRYISTIIRDAIESYLGE